MMEHRIGERMPAYCQADIYRGEEKLGTFAVKNIGINGLCVDNADNCLCADTFLQVIFTLPSTTTTLTHRSLNYAMNAFVVWTDNRRAGLMWTAGGFEFPHLIDELSQHAA